MERFAGWFREKGNFKRKIGIVTVNNRKRYLFEELKYVYNQFYRKFTLRRLK